MSLPFPSGYICITVDMHIPFLSSRRTDRRFWENWLCRSLLLSYLPLIDMMHRLHSEGVRYRLTLSITPVLLEMLTSPVLPRYFNTYVNRINKALDREESTATVPSKIELITHYRQCLQYYNELFTDRYQGDIVAQLRILEKQGCLELLASSATGAYLPILEPNEPLSQAQITMGCHSYRKHFGHQPRGFWSKCCGYTPGLDKLLLQAGLQYTVVRSMSVLGASPLPRSATHLPIQTPTGLTIFPTDIESMLVLFHKKTGYVQAVQNLHTDYIPQRHSGYHNSEGLTPIHVHLYSKQRDIGDFSRYYDVQQGLEIAQRQATQFVRERYQQANWIATRLGSSPILTITLKAEMLGQGWFEGIAWLEEVLRQTAKERRKVLTATLGDVHKLQQWQICTPNSGSSERGSFNANWLNESNAWVYKNLYLAGKRLVKICAQGHDNSNEKCAILNQAVRELLLAQSSDWCSLIGLNSEANWARSRVSEHLQMFHKLFDDFCTGRTDFNTLRKLEQWYPVFAELDYREILP